MLIVKHGGSAGIAIMNGIHLFLHAHAEASALVEWHNTFIKCRNDLKTTHPEIAEEWSEKNYPLQPDEVNAKSEKKMCGGIVRNVAMNGSQSSMPE